MGEWGTAYIPYLRTIAILCPHFTVYEDRMTCLEFLQRDTSDVDGIEAVATMPEQNAVGGSTGGVCYPGVDEGGDTLLTDILT